MKNCLVFGSGRSGTSMMGGILYDAGYFMGRGLYPSCDSNPKGFFENAYINGINEVVLSKYDKPDKSVLKKVGLRRSPTFRHLLTRVPPRLKRRFCSTVYSPDELQRWLLSIPPTVKILSSNEEVASRIKRAVQHGPYAYKDPRISYTLPVWKEFLDEDTILICIYREPDVTVTSILKECCSRKYLGTLAITEREAFEVWSNMYMHVLKNWEADNSNFIFVHYNQVFEGGALPKIGELLDAELKHDFVSKELKRSEGGCCIPDEVRNVYAKLCELSDYKEHWV